MAHVDLPDPSKPGAAVPSAAVRVLGVLGLFTPGARATDPGADGLRRLLRGDTPDDGCDWDAIATAARHCEVPTLAAAGHPELNRRLSRAARRQALVDMNLELALDRVARALNGAGIERVALLKGSATAYTLYDAPQQRVRRDVDILVSDADMAEVVRALRMDGWRNDAGPSEARRGPLKVRAWPLVLDLPIGEITCDVHRRLAAWESFNIDVEGILDRRVPTTAPLASASLEDLFLHTAIHLAVNGFHEPLKAWVDLVRLLRRSELDRGVIAQRARAWNASTAVWCALRVLYRWFGVEEPDLANATRPEPARASALRWLLSGDGLYPLRSDVDKAVATAATALLVMDSAPGRVRWVLTALGRRLRLR